MFYAKENANDSDQIDIMTKYSSELGLDLKPKGSFVVWTSVHRDFFGNTFHPHQGELLDLLESGEPIELSIQIKD